MTAGTLLDEDFEDDAVGSPPDGWDSAGNDRQRVTDAVAGEGDQSFELRGSHGGCWEAIAHHELDVPIEGVMTLRGLYRPGDGRVGCHSNKLGRVLLRTATGGTYPGDAVWLLTFRTDGTIRALGENLGEYDADGWNSFEVAYDRNPGAGTVTLQYTINGRDRLTKTREERSFEDDLGYVSLQSGDFTTYWDGLHAEVGDGAETVTSRETAATTRTPTPTTTDGGTTRPARTTTGRVRTTTPPVGTTADASHEYDLRAGTRQRVEVDGRPYYVIRDVPNAEPDRRAVTTTDYELVSRDVGIDALTAEYYGNDPGFTDWAAEVERAKNHRDQAKDLELFGRAVDAGWDVTIIVDSFLVGHPQLAIGNAINLLTDGIGWAYTEYEDPFQEGFTKLTATLTNVRTIQEKADRMESNAELGSQVNDLVSAFMLGADAGAAGAGLTSAWGKAITALEQSRAASTSADDALAHADDLATGSVDDAVSASSQLFVGFALSLTVGEINSAVKAKTKIHSAELAYETVRVPLLRRLEALQRRARNYSLTRAEALEYDVGRATNYQMGAILFQLGADYWQAISDQPTGIVWDVVTNADGKAKNYRGTADDLEVASKWRYLSVGQRTREVDERWQTSINADVLGGES